MATGPVNKTNGQTPSAAALSTLSTGKAAEAQGAKGVIGAKGLKDPKSLGRGDMKAGSNVDVQISPRAKERAEAMQKATEIAMATPDIREDKVAHFKKQIQDGTYKADSGNIADGMLREAIKDHIALSDER